LPTPPRSCQVTVVGGGITGLSAALFLARAGRAVAVLDWGEPWGESSGANAGTLSLQVKRTEVLPIGRKSLELWRDFDREMELDVGFGQLGGLRIATSAAQAGFLRVYAEEQRGAGLETEWLEGAVLRARAPWLGPTVEAATYCAQDAYSIPLRAGPALIAAARAAGAEIHAGCQVVGMVAAGDGYRIDTTRGEMTCDAVAIVAGGHSGRLAAMLGAFLPLYVDVNMLAVTEPAPPLIDRVVTHIGGVLSLKQHPNGTVLIGGGWQGRGSFDAGTREVDHLRWMQNLRLAVEAVPGLEAPRVNRVWAGYEAVTSDALPILGRVPGHGQAYVAAGARGGYHMGPVQGFLLSEMILTGETSIPIDLFDPARFTP
jgi:glycine/D-amino acid oxidase-like deaminating enzyme